MRSPARAKALPHTDAPRPAPAQTMPTPTGGRPTKTERPQRFPQREPHPITIMSPTRHPARSRTEISMGARAHESDDPRPRNHSPPTSPDPRLTGGHCTDKPSAKTWAALAVTVAERARSAEAGQGALRASDDLRLFRPRP